MPTERRVQPVPTRRKKVSIEIYFVLYLTAIILLLGTTPAHHGMPDEAVDDVVRHLLVPDFRVHAQKAALVYSVVPAGSTVDTTGAMLKRDSLNTVTAYGSFASVRFSIASIEDSASSKPVPTERAALIPRGDRSAIFQWTPSSADRDAVYRVTVVGRATPQAPENLRPEIREKATEFLQRMGTVADSVTFTVSVFAVRDMAGVRRVMQEQTFADARNDLAAATAPSLAPSALGPTGIGGVPFDLLPSQASIPVPAGTHWQNQINLSGAASFSDLEISVSGGAQITERAPTRLMLTGMAPAAGGAQQITVTAVNRTDGRRVVTTFDVRGVAQSPLSMTLPGTLIAGQTYPLDFTPTGIESRRISVEVYENDRVVIGRVEGRSSMRYRAPDGGHVRFVRYVDDRVLDQTTIDVRPLPAPTVAIPQATSRDAQEVRVTTTTYGDVSGDVNRGVLKIMSGNAEEPDLESESVDERTKQVRRVWVVRRRDRRNEFRFRMYVIDARGSRNGKSQEVEFVAAR